MFRIFIDFVSFFFFLIYIYIYTDRNKYIENSHKLKTKVETAFHKLHDFYLFFFPEDLFGCIISGTSW